MHVYVRVVTSGYGINIRKSVNKNKLGTLGVISFSRINIRIRTLNHFIQIRTTYRHRFAKSKNEAIE